VIVNLNNSAVTNLCEWDPEYSNRSMGQLPMAESGFTLPSKEPAS